MIDAIKHYVLTDASLTRLEMDQYTFDVDPHVSKTEIKRLFEAHYGVRVIRVNTHRPPRTKTRVGRYMGQRRLLKRVIVTVAPGEVLFQDI